MASQDAAPDKLLLGAMGIAKEAQTPKDVMSRFGELLKSTYGIDQVIVKDKQGQLGTVDEFTINTGKPYVDNSLSSYSTFSELIRYYNEGFKCCMVLPIAKEGKSFGTVTLLSRNDQIFTQGLAEMLWVVSGLVSGEASVKFEKDKSLSLARYFDASFNSVLPQLLVEQKGAIVKANKSAMNQFDRNQKELANESLADVFDISSEEISRLMGGMPVSAYGRESRDRMFELTSNRINDSLFHVLVRDVSPIREAKAKTFLMDNSDVEVFIALDLNGRITWASENMERMLKVSKDVVIGKSFFDFVENQHAVREQVGSSKGTYSGHVSFNFGNDIEIGAKLTVLKGDGLMSCIISTDYDRFIKSLEKNFDDLVSLSNESIIRVDKSGYILSFNKSAERLFRLGKDNVGTQIYAMCAEKESQDRLTSSMAIARSNGFISDVFVNMLDLSGSQSIPCQQTIKAITDEKDAVVGYLVVSRELLTKRELEQAREDRNRLARDVEKLKTESELKSQFIYNISHDLKTPITNIMGFSKLMLTDDFGPLTKEQRDNISIIYDESERFMQLVKQILDVAKLSSGIVKMDLQTVKFKDIEENPSIKSLAEACANKGLEFRWIVDQEVPDITADPNRLIQVFSNLISNAIKFTEKGSITVKVYRKGRSVRVDVTDTGIGISKEDRTKIFKKFYQLKRGLVQQKGAGTGLGLSIAKEVVNLHSGSMSLVSDVGKGSTFWFTIPITPKMKKKTMQYNRSEIQEQH